MSFLTTATATAASAAGTATAATGTAAGGPAPVIKVRCHLVVELLAQKADSRPVNNWIIRAIEQGVVIAAAAIQRARSQCTASRNSLGRGPRCLGYQGDRKVAARILGEDPAKSSAWKNRRALLTAAPSRNTFCGHPRSPAPPPRRRAAISYQHAGTLRQARTGDMGKDYYKILGVSRDAGDEELKKACVNGARVGWEERSALLLCSEPLTDGS